MNAVSTLTSIDQLGNKIEINFPLKRIVSLVPSQTELLFDLGLDSEIVGITRFCIHPEEKIKTKRQIGGTKQFNIEKIIALQPDLIIANKEENYEEGIAELQKYFPVWLSDIYTLDDAYTMMREVSRITNRDLAGNKIIDEIKTNFSKLSAVNGQPLTVAYFIWRKPYMVAAKNTFIHSMLEVFGLKNVFDDLERYPEINPAMLAERKPDFIFLSSEPYSFASKHFAEFQSFSPSSKVMIVDGEMFSWYGSRLRFTGKYFEELRKELDLYSAPF